MTFDNGYTVSVQWGPQNYCKNRNLDTLGDYTQRRLHAGRLGCETCEVAVWDSTGKWLDTDEWAGDFAWLHDQVVGDLRSSQVADILARVASFPTR
jgi:hypothetical protein